MRITAVAAVDPTVVLLVPNTRSPFVCPASLVCSYAITAGGLCCVAGPTYPNPMSWKELVWLDCTPICRFAFELPKVCSGLGRCGGEEVGIGRSAIARGSRCRQRARPMEASRAGAGAAERGNRGGGIKIPDVTSATGVTTAPWEGDRGVDSVGLRTRTPFVVRYLDAAVLSRATRHGRCEKGGGDRGRAGSVPTWRIRVRGD